MKEEVLRTPPIHLWGGKITIVRGKYGERKHYSMKPASKEASFLKFINTLLWRIQIRRILALQKYQLVFCLEGIYGIMSKLWGGAGARSFIMPYLPVSELKLKLQMASTNDKVPEHWFSSGGQDPQRGRKLIFRGLQRAWHHYLESFFGTTICHVERLSLRTWWESEVEEREKTPWESEH